MRQSAIALAPLSSLVALLALGSCGGGGGGGGGEPPPPAPPEIGVFPGFKDGGNLDWESLGGGEGGVGDGGADGDGGVGAGGDFGQFRGANVCVFLDNGTQLGCALTDNLKGMVTIKPGRDYKGGLRIELSGTPTATYYEEGRDTYVPFPADRKIRVWVPYINRNIGITPFTEAAYRLLTEGSAPESVGANPSKDQIRAANERVRLALNEHFPTALHVDDIARLPFIKSQSLPAGSMRTDPRGRYGLVNGAFSKQASFHNGDSASPTLDAVRQLSTDMLDGRIDGRNGTQPAAPAAARTYDPNTLTGELSSALGEQAARFGAQEALDVLPKVLNFGNVRYEGYLFDGSISKTGRGNSTVTGWVADNTKGFTTGQQFDRLPSSLRALALYANNGHGGGFYKAQFVDPTTGAVQLRMLAIGDNVNGELGLGTRDRTNAAALPLTLPGTPSHIVGGFAHTLARMADGTVWAWGDNSFGQLGQNNASLANSLAPLRVNLPVAAVAVAAANTTSYALGVDGKVYAWGANGGFGLLGSGSADGVAQAPVEVAGLTEIVQISARDNDVVVVKRDNTVWHWGSHPAAETGAFQAGNPAAPYLGGRTTPTQVSGLPAGVAVRKVLTEQGLFAALLSNGHVYTWGVHFDITAGEVLHNPQTLNASRVLGLPPLRDMMPGGFQGYGTRAFDRLTGMGVDYSGGMWKIRGRVGEVYDPDTEASRGAQRRPQGQGPRVDCEACHTFLDQSLAEIKAASQQPTSGPECAPPASAHLGATAALIHTETDCVQCHNPARVNYPVTTPSGQMPFAATNGWPDCAKPLSTLLPRSAPVPPQTLSNSCTVPPNHVFTPPGTVCASCHNSVIARPLRELPAACAQPLSSELPTIAIKATLTGAFTTGGTAIAAGASTSAVLHELRGTLSAPLAAGQAVTIERLTAAGKATVGNAAVSDTSWTLTATTPAPEGAVSYRAFVTNGAAFGAYSNVVAFTVDTVAPTVTAAVIGFTDDALGAIAPGGTASDSTPTVNGTLSGALGAGESVQVLRNGVAVGLGTVTGANWSYTEASALGAAAYSYQARTIDSAGNTTAAQPAGGATLTIVDALATATITQALNNSNGVIANGSTTNDNTPAFTGTVSAPLPAGQVVRMYRDGSLIGTATLSATSWSLTDSGASDGTRVYTARVEAGAVLGASSAAYTITIDTVAPVQTAAITQVSDDVLGVLVAPYTTTDVTPTVSGTLSAGLATGEVVQVLRGGTVIGQATMTGATTWTFTEPAPGVAVPTGSSVTVSYTARVLDAAGLTGPASPGISVTVSPGSFPLATITAEITAMNGLAPGPVSYNLTQTVGGTLTRALASNERVAIYRNTVTPVLAAPPCGTGTATLAGSFQSTGATTFSIATNTVPGVGTYFHVARVELVGTPSTCGPSQNTVSSVVVAAPTAAVTAIRDDAGTSYADGALTSDTTPQVQGTVSRTPQPGEQLVVVRNGSAVATIPWAGTTWTYTEPTALPANTYAYAVRPRDAAGIAGTTSPTRSIGVVTNLPTASITAINGSTTFPVITNTTAPQLSITLGANLPAGYVVRVLRNSTPLAGGLTTCAPSCTFTDSVSTNTTYTYTARTETGGATSSTVGTALGPISVGRSMTLDTVAPAAPTMSGIADNKPYQNLTNTDTNQTFTTSSAAVPIVDATPIIVASLSGGLVTGETARIYRWIGAGAPSSTTLPNANWQLMTTGSSGSTLQATESSAALRRPDIEGAPPLVLAAQRYYFATRSDPAGNVASSAIYTVNHGYQTCSAWRAQNRTGQNHASYTSGSGPTATFTIPITSATTTSCSSCHTTSGVYVAAPAIGASYTDRYWCVR